MKAKSSYYRSSLEVNKTNMKNNWNLITRISDINVNKNCIHKILFINNVYESDYEIAEVFNSYFSEIGVALDEDPSTVNKTPLNYLLINNALYICAFEAHCTRWVFKNYPSSDTN